jgi:transcriptional regulator with XRE-family HTH domain
MDIEGLKLLKKQKKMTLQQISDMSGIPKRTVDDIFSGKTKNPRIDTMQAIERALGLENEKTPTDELSEGEKQLIALIKELTDEEAQELSNYIDFIISKRK